MKKLYAAFFLSLFLIPKSSTAYKADLSDYFIIEKILVFGNKKTKEDIVLRELTLNKGDTLFLQDIEKETSQSKKQLLNTFLFTEVHVYTDSISTLYVELTEDWYIWPIPIVKFADRNFNTWWKTKDLNRLDYGINLMWYNHSGRNDLLSINIQAGYTNKFAVSYSRPFIDKKKTFGYSLLLGYSANREVWIKPENDKLVFFSNLNNFIISRYFSGVEFTYRKKFFTKHFLSFTHSYVNVADTIVSQNENPKFLLDGKKSQNLFQLTYNIVIDKRDIRGYALNGTYANFAMGLDLFNQNQVNLKAMSKIAFYHQFKNRFNFSSGLTGKVNSMNSLPYNNIQSLGYENRFIRGYEYYVIDGNAYIFGRNNLKYALVKDYKSEINHILKNYSKLTFSMYVGPFYDLGHVRSNENYTNNRLPNTLLQGYGIGIDFVFYYDRILRVEMSQNKERQRGLYLHFYSPI
jgi:outer membrane protein assembly factor BamA